MSVKVEFEVSPSSRNIPAKYNEIVKWYNDRSLSQTESENIVIKYIQGSGNRYHMSFNMKEGETPDTRKNAIFLAELIADPDADGNHPLDDGELVHGTIIEKTLRHRRGKEAIRMAKETKAAAKQKPRSTTQKAQQLPKKGRCPNGSRRIPPKTGECVKNGTQSPPTVKNNLRNSKTSL